MKYSITFYLLYELQAKTLSISISKKDDEYILTEIHSTESLDTPRNFPKEEQFRHLIPMLQYLMDIFTKFYTDSISYNSVDRLPPTHYIDNYGISINRYIMMVNSAKIKMESSVILYNKIIKDITSKLDKAAFIELLKIKNMKYSQILNIVADIIFKFL